ncbi:hypothetical protein BDW69DRAFT_205332 [Aspergillus filifer]
MAFRVPLPYKCGERYYPGNCEEKLRSEAATYIWINENCPDDLVSQAGSCHEDRLSGPRYTLIDWIENEDEQVLSNVYRQPHTEEQTQNLYRGMAKIIVSLARVPQPRIGSWTINNDGRLSLSNRPLLCQLQELENIIIPSGLARHTTYTSADTFCLDLLDGHDNRLRYQKSAVFSERDGRRQAVDLVLMRSTLSRFTDRSVRDGPFLMHLTDMHISNMFVEGLESPRWLTGQKVDDLTGIDQKPHLYKGTTYSLAATMDRAFDEHHYWYLVALQCPKGLFNLWREQLQPLYDEESKDSLCEAVSPFWAPGMRSFMNMKLKDFADYIQQVRHISNSPESGKIYMR